ncbi:sensor histidine kinase [Xanthomonas campestris pv. campestris]|nr:HAMP domain-containing protein [Xanthomonas campestris pv. campestris]
MAHQHGNATRREQERHMVKARIYAGITVIVLFGVMSMLYVYRGLADVVGHLTRLEQVDAPFSIAALEMEKNVGEYAFGVLQYVAQPLPDVRAETSNDSADFSQYHANYMQLSSTRREIELGRHLARDFDNLTRIGATLMDKRDGLDVTFEKVNGLLGDIDALVNQQILHVAPTPEPMRRRTLAALANVEAEAAKLGFWLSAYERRPTALTTRQLLERAAKLDRAIAGYRQLPLQARERRLAGEVEVLHVQVKRGVDALLTGEDAMTALASDFVRLQNHMDDVSDEEIEPLAAKGLTAPQKEADRIAVRVLNMLGYAIPLYLIVALLVGALLILSIVRPLRKLASGTKAIGAGDLHYRIVERGKDEFDDLARQFNLMVTRLQESTVSKALLEESEQKLKLTVTDLRQEIAERERSERERGKLQAELRRSEAMAAVGALMAGVAHEVRNPLFGISSTLDAMEATFNTGRSGGRHQEVLRREVRRLNKLMTDLLEYGRPPTEEFSSGRLGNVIAEATRICAPIADAGNVVIDNQADSYDGVLLLNHGRMPQVFVNLIENAVQHAPAGSRVVITARTLDENGRAPVECRVQDAGSGFAPDDLPLIFDPFFTRRRKGTGLGLAIVQRIVEEHKGTIAGHNSPEGGAVMVMRLPFMG